MPSGAGGSTCGTGESRWVPVGPVAPESPGRSRGAVVAPRTSGSLPAGAAAGAGLRADSPGRGKRARGSGVPGVARARSSGGAERNVGAVAPRGWGLAGCFFSALVLVYAGLKCLVDLLIDGGAV